MTRTLLLSLTLCLITAMPGCTPLQAGTDSGPTVTGSIMVTSPNGGETWVKGRRYTLRWQSRHTGDQVLIRLLRMDRTDIYEVDANAPNTGRYVYTVLGNIPTGRYRLSVKDSHADTEDRSDRDLNIVLPPVDLGCRVDTRYSEIGEGKFRRKVLQYKVLVRNRGTRTLKDVSYKLLITKQPENVVIRQDGGSFDSVHPDKWYASGWLTDYGDKGQHRIEAIADPENLQAEVAALRIDNSCYTEGISD